MDRVTLRVSDRAAFSARVAGRVEGAAAPPLAPRPRDRPASVVDRHAALESFRRRHRDGADPIFTKMLLHFEGELGRIAVDLVFELERVINAGQLGRVFEFHVHHRTDDLNDSSFIHNCGQAPTAIWAVEISSSSVVMLAWRILLYSRV